MANENYKQEKKTILITGGAGFVGHHSVEHLLKNTNWNIVVLDSLNYAGNLNRLVEAHKAAGDINRIVDIDVFDPKRIKFVWHDLRAPISQSTAKLIGDIDYCCHYAAESIPENIYIPIQSTPNVGTRMMTFGELWQEQAKGKKIYKTKKGEAIFLKGKQVKALSFLNNGQWMPIRAITRHKYKGKIIKLIQKWGIIEATPNHSIYGSNLELTNPVNNPELLVARKVNEFRKKYKKVSQDLLKIMAAYITEGSLVFNVANGSYLTQICQGKKDWLVDIGESIKREFGYKSWIITHKKKKYQNTFELQVSNKALFQYLLKNCGKYCDQKHFPNFIFDLEPAQREFFWKKLLEGDGTADGRYSTTSYKLANQIGLLLTLLRKEFSVFEHDRKNKNYKRSWDFKTNPRNFHRGQNQKKKLELNYDGWVYDIEVEESHNFLCGIGNVVCHNSHVDRSLEYSVPFVESNVLGTANLLEYLKHSHAQCKTIIFGTDEVFGPAPEGVYFKENDSFRPSNPYAASKAGEEMIAFSFAHAFGLPIFVARSMNIIGERQHPEKFVPKTIKAILNNEKIILHGRTSKDLSSRCWIHARNVADGVLFLFGKGEKEEFYHIVGEEKTVLEMANWVCEVIKGRPLQENEIEWVDYHTARPGHDKRYALSGEKMAQMGWLPPVDLERSLKKSVQWMLDNNQWLNL